MQPIKELFVRRDSLATLIFLVLDVIYDIDMHGLFSLECLNLP